MTEKTLLNNEWAIGKEIGCGGFGQIYLAANIHNKKLAAVKVEDLRKSELLFIEASILKSLNIEGIPQYYWSGKFTNNSNKYCLVEELLGPSVEDLFKVCGGKFSLKTTLLLADQLMQRIEYFHSMNFIHRDIKPNNFAMGIYEKSNVLYLLDFNLSRRFKDAKTLHHIPYKENTSMVGTARYASINAHLSIEQSRRDDLESLGYVLVYFLKGHLPW